MLRNKVENQDSTKQKTAARKPKDSMYYERHISSYKIQFEVKLILDETWLEDNPTIYNIGPLDLGLDSYEFFNLAENYRPQT